MDKDAQETNVQSQPIVTEIAEAFELDFTNRTSMTFGGIQYTNSEGSPVIIVKIKINLRHKNLRT